MTPTRDDFRKALQSRFARAFGGGLAHVWVQSGDLHREVGGYPGENHRISLCCSVMRDEMYPTDLLIEAPPAGHGANLVIQYVLPRPETASPDGS